MGPQVRRFQQHVLSWKQRRHMQTQHGFDLLLVLVQVSWALLCPCPEGHAACEGCWAKWAEAHLSDLFFWKGFVDLKC